MTEPTATEIRKQFADALRLLSKQATRIEELETAAKYWRAKYQSLEFTQRREIEGLKKFVIAFDFYINAAGYSGMVPITHIRNARAALGVDGE